MGSASTNLHGHRRTRRTAGRSPSRLRAADCSIKRDGAGRSATRRAAQTFTITPTAVGPVTLTRAATRRFTGERIGSEPRDCIRRAPTIGAAVAGNGSASVASGRAGEHGRIGQSPAIRAICVPRQYHHGNRDNQPDPQSRSHSQTARTRYVAGDASDEYVPRAQRRIGRLERRHSGVAGYGLHAERSGGGSGG